MDIVLGVLSVTEKHLPHFTKPNLSDNDLSIKTLLTWATASTATCRPETDGWPPMPRRQREVCRRDVRHTSLIISENERSRDCCCIGWKKTERRRNKRTEKCGGHRICDRRNYGFFSTIFEDLRRDETKFFF